MSIEVLLALLLWVASFISGRLQVSGLEKRQECGEALMFFVIALFTAIFLPIFGLKLWWVGVASFVLFVVGVTGKNSLKLPLRHKARLWDWFGEWKLPRQNKPDEHQPHTSPTKER